MHDASVQAADRLEADVLRKLERLYPAAVSPLMAKHRTTFDKLARLEKDGAYSRARVMLRRSGLVNDLARAIASAGREAAALIRAEVADIREVVANEPEADR